ncbi:uncharacterized protein [Henckelia pumila]|uniref:uncharacterized protein n=1 Tax=Henckelia pumila TaxID=405737 RepID=UPI003C6E2781
MPNQPENEPVDESLNQPQSQLTQDMLFERPSKLQARRKVRLTGDIMKGQPTNSKAVKNRRLKGNGPIQTTTNQWESSGDKDDNIVNSLPLSNVEVAAIITPSITIPTPSMFEQLKQCQVSAHTVNVRSSGPFVGGCYIPSIEKCVTQSCTTSKPVITEGGNKYVKLSNIASTLSQIKDAKENKNRGKKVSK